MEIRRDRYLDGLVARKDNGLAKVVTGVRRCGKSYLVFELFRRHLLDEDVPEANIVEVAFDRRSARPLRDPDVALAHISERLDAAGPGERYVLLDEVRLLPDFVEVLASATGSLTNASKIRATFRSELGSDISLNTVKAYIGHLEDAFLVSGASRYNIKGRRYIGTPEKYYFEDVGLRNARLGFRQVKQTHLMENAVYNELMARGYSVDVGVVRRHVREADGTERVDALEVDFVANLAGRRYYVQSAYALPDEAKREQEKASLRRIDDSFKKIVVVRDVVNTTRDEI